MNNNGPENLREQNPTMPQFFEDCKQVKLSEICTKGNSSLRQKDVFNNGPYRVYGASGIVGTMDKYQNEVPYVAVVKDGAGVGRANRCDPMTSVLGTMQALIPNPNVERDYLLHLIRSLRLGDGFSGSTIPHIYFKDYGKIEVPLPSIDTQKRIVSRLGSVEAQIAQAEAQIEQLDSLVKSRFVEMLKRCDFSTIKRLDSFAKRVKVGFVGTVGKYYTDDSGIPMVRTTNITSTGLDLSELKYVTEEFDRRNMKSHLCSGDVVIARHGKNGQACVYRGPEAQCLNVVVVEPDEAQLTSVCIEHLLNSDYAREQVSSKLVGSTQKVVNTSAVASLLVPTIPLALQQEFAAFVAQVDKLRFETQQQIEKLETLKKSLMQEYFG